MRTKDWLKELARYYMRGGYMKKYLVFYRKDDYYFTDELLTVQEKQHKINSFAEQYKKIAKKYRENLRKKNRKFKRSVFDTYIKEKAKEYFVKNILPELMGGEKNV